MTVPLDFPSIEMRDITLQQTLQKGAVGEVVKVTYKQRSEPENGDTAPKLTNNTNYAMKIISPARLKDCLASATASSDTKSALGDSLWEQMLQVHVFNHRNIVNAPCVVNTGQDAEQQGVLDELGIKPPPALLMELAVVDLRTVLTERGALSIADAATIMGQVVLAVEALHCDHGVIHRDIKPENVLFLPSGVVAITDFGTSMSFHQPLLNKFQDLQQHVCTAGGMQPKLVERQTKAFQGTPHYIAPEIIQGAKEPSFAVDLWSLGTILYEMIEGTKAFDAPSDYMIWRSVMDTDPEFGDTTPVEVQELCRALLTKKPEERLGNSWAAKNPKKMKKEGVDVTLGEREALQAVKSHPFFEKNGIADWASLATQKQFTYTFDHHDVTG
eukprot:TRINITY_DN62081_c1_g4_i1.p1 TRINITY_DN62081_c1_g4~~TRINITY_DN62081_c1_g4_i1.p1  ORF type:complete len:431 (+),score=49.47 TRINITY_DN62081_c1_g4_i1:138-1295(+)